MVVKAGIVTTQFENLLLVDFVAMKSEEGNKDTISHWLRLYTFNPGMNFYNGALLEAKASKKAVLNVRRLRSVSFIGS